MKQTHLLAIATSILAIATTSCFDDKYDLSDIDKTVELKVDRLVVPINIDHISLSSIIDETSNIQVIDGQYAYVTDGTFDSDPINIDGITVKVTKINDTDVSLKNALGGQPNPHVDIDYDIAEATPTDYAFESENISENLLGLSRIDGTTQITISLDLSGVKGFASKVQLSGVKIELPKHLLTSPHPDGTYDYNTGIFTLRNQLADVNSGLIVKLDVVGLDILDGEFNPTAHTLNVNGQVGLTDGVFTIPAEYQSQTLPERLNLTISYDIADFEVSTVTGVLQYEITDVDIPEVNLNDIPDFLNQPGTNLILANPQLYLRANNPLCMYDKLYAQTGLEITALRKNDAGSITDKKTVTLDKPFAIGGVHNVENFNFVLCPQKPATTDPAYPNPQFEKFSSLGQILSGDGLPNTLKVNLIDPMIPSQPIVDFQVGKKYSAIQGSWKFIAPFALSAGSVIMYSDVVDGWSSEDLDKLVITYMEVNVKVSTDIPVGVNFTSQPLGKDGKPIAGAKITGAVIKPMAKDEPVTIKVEMPADGIRYLDGIKFEAAASSEDGPALSPDMTITLTNIRPCVSGYYQTEL